MLRSPLINVMVNAVLKAGKGLKRDFGELENLQVSMKGPGDFVSIADKRAERILHQELEKARPGYGFVMEEGGILEGSDTTHRWLIDPLDGTVNFLHGLPFFCTSIGLERDGVLVAGVIYNPATDEMFVAERGSGAYHNGRRIRVAGRKALAETLICGSLAGLGRGDHPLSQREIAVVAPKVAGIRRMGATALELAYVAAGRFDGLWQRWVEAWDIAAGAVLVREAGGFITGLDGEDLSVAGGTILAGNEAVHRELLETLRRS